MDDTKYFIKNKNFKTSNIVKDILLELTIKDVNLNISKLNKLSLYVDVLNTTSKNFKFIEDSTSLFISLKINGHLEYLSLEEKIKLFNFSLPKKAPVSIKTCKLSSNSIFTDIHINECIVRKLSLDSFYLALIGEFHFNDLY
ncbi:MAG: hypothetical protein ACRCWG_11960 [Sarcina sp.]